MAELTTGLEACAAGICCCFVSWKVCIKKLIEKGVRGTVEKKAPGFLGDSKLRLNEFNFNCCPFWISLGGMTINNLQGFKSEYLVQIGKITVQIAICKAITSRGKDVGIPSIVIENLDLILEKNSVTESNVSVLLKKMKGDKKKEEDKSFYDQLLGKGEEAPKKTKDKGGVKIDIVKLSGITCRATSAIQIDNGVPPAAKVKVDDVQIKLGGDKVDPQTAITRIITEISTKVLESGAVKEAMSKFGEIAEEWTCTVS